jgi:glycosyltransferase involved in cell wall biosynthesis
MINESINLIRVANIIEEARIGGPQIRMLFIASALEKKFHTTIIFPKLNSSDFQKRCEAIGVKYIVSSLTTIRRNLINIVKYLILFPYEVISLSLKLKKNNFDIVHVSGGSWQYKGLLAAKLAGIKVVWELNDTYAPFIIKCVFFFLSHLANGFIYGSERTKEYYKKLVPRKSTTFLIQSPVDVDFYDPSLEYKEDDQVKKFVQNKKIIIGTVSNVNPVKGLEIFIKSAIKLKCYRDNIIFLIIGSVYENQKKYFRSLVDLLKDNQIENVHFIEPRNDVRSLLKVIDIYVCSSKNESSPLSVWEAMSMKKAIVSTDVGDVDQFISDGNNGFIVKVDNVNDLSKKIAQLIDQPKLRIMFGNSAREVAKNKLDLKICSKLHGKMYWKIIGNFK